MKPHIRKRFGGLRAFTALKSYRPLLWAVSGVLAAFGYFTWQVRSRAYTQSDYENDRRISEALGLDCEKLDGAAFVGKNVADVDRFARLRNSILFKEQRGFIETTDEDESRSERIVTQSYTVCGTRFVAVVYGDLIVEAIPLPRGRKGRVFGIDG